jgi:hypothetical protein
MVRPGLDETRIGEVGMSESHRPSEDLVTADDAGAAEVVAAEAAERLASICAGWPADRFRALVLDVARVRLHHRPPRAEFVAMQRQTEARRRAAARPAITPPPVPLPSPRGYPAAQDPSASAPT